MSLGRRAPGGADVVDQDIQPPVLGDDAGRQGLGGLGVG
jgi:hypothetical protein